MKWGVQVVRGNTHNVGSTSVILQFASGRYLFNCGEGTQRLSFENKTRISKLTAIFLTRVDWDNMGGLPGMLLTLAETGSQNLVVCGGHNLTHAMAAMRHFILRSDMGVGVKELRDGDAAAAFSDENIRVTPVHIYPTGYTVSAHEQGADESDAAAIRRMLLERAFGVHKAPEPTDRKKREPPQPQQKKGYYGQECKEAAIEQVLQKFEQQDEDRTKKRSLSPGHSPKRSSDVFLPLATPTPCALCYIVEGPEVPGKFDSQAARDLGLKPGPQFAQLVRGQTITTADGQTIRPEQCVGPARPSSLVIIIDCPSPAYIDSLTTAHQFVPFLEGTKTAGPQKDQLMMIVHSLGPGVAQDARYKKWAAQFPAHVRHMVSAPEYVPDNNPFQRHLRIHAAMHAISPHTYILPQATDKAELPLHTFLDSKNLVAPKSMMMYDIEPEPKLDESMVTQLLTAEQMLAKVDDVTPPSPHPNDGDDLVVCPIGTGSSVPSTYRNVSSNIVSVKGFGGIVLDCGESTVSQLKRFLGFPRRNHANTRIQQSYTEFLKTLKLLYVSHMHADHHLGAIQLLHEWNQATQMMDPKPRLSVLAPARFWAWLEDFSGVQDLGLDRLDFISCSDIRLIDPTAKIPIKENQKYRTAVTKLKSDLGLVDILTCGVIHCPWAYGLSLTHYTGWKLVYSGDTRPCANLVTLGRAGDKPPTVLLHEATLPDYLHVDAVAKRHSTVSEAVAMALGMGAENLLLTHFSQRCLDLPRWTTANIEAVKVARYGYVASASTSVGSSVDDVEDSATDLDVDDDDIDAGAGVDFGHVNDLETYGQDVAEQTDAPNAALNAVLGDLKIASAFDMSAYAPRDIKKYRYNTHRLKQVLHDEMKLFIAEESADTVEPSQLKKGKQKAKAKKGKDSA
ncbi:hypothetical protein EV176_001016 [Coemansia sp. RSA 451]|nr:hypothetical protein EV176_001016 [Coemansia sp. RSA 451]